MKSVKLVKILYLIKEENWMQSVAMWGGDDERTDKIGQNGGVEFIGASVVRYKDG